MNAGQLAALIAAGFFAVLACVAMFVLLRLARLMSAVTGMVTEYRARADQLIEQAQAAVDRTNEQLIRTDAITASMDQVTANMAELSGHVSALAGLARGISTAVSAPLSGMSALLFGVRRAVLVRRSLEAAAAAAEHPAERLPGTQPAAITGTITTVSERAGGASGGRPPAEAQRGASGGRPPAGAERGASGGRPPAETQRRASARRREGAGQR
jgi:mannose/fructose-specific phosphotransferase system component IIA